MIPLTRVMLFKHERHSMAFNFYILQSENPPYNIYHRVICLMVLPLGRAQQIAT